MNETDLNSFTKQSRMVCSLLFANILCVWFGGGQHLQCFIRPKTFLSPSCQYVTNVFNLLQFYSVKASCILQILQNSVV